MPFPDKCPKCGTPTDCAEVDTNVGVHESPPWCTDPECGWSQATELSTLEDTDDDVPW